MSKQNLYHSWLKKNGYKLKTVYSFAVVNKLNIKLKDDVLKALEVTDPENANNDQAEIYLKMLQLFESRFKKSISKKLES